MFGWNWLRLASPDYRSFISLKCSQKKRTPRKTNPAFAGTSCKLRWETNSDTARWHTTTDGETSIRNFLVRRCNLYRRMPARPIYRQSVLTRSTAILIMEGSFESACREYQDCRAGNLHVLSSMRGHKTSSGLSVKHSMRSLHAPPQSSSVYSKDNDSERRTFLFSAFLPTLR